MVSKPHGGKLVRKLMASRTRERVLEEINEFPRIEISERVAIDLENIAHGVYSPLSGFLCSDELENVLEYMRLPNDIPWTIPIILDVADRGEFDEGDAIVLYHHGQALARMYIDEIYGFDKSYLAEKVFGTKNVEHPGVAKVYRMENLLIGGEIELISEIPNKFERYTLRPIETRVLFRERKWESVVAFQTRNVPHLGHEYIQKSALMFVDGLFVNPVVGRKKSGDYKDEVILQAYEKLFEHYFPKNAAVLAIVRYEMRYAGPREAVHHAIMRKNFGCTHFIVGRDHAGVGNYYKPYDAQEIFNEFPDLGITPMFFWEFFYCRRCQAIVNERICPHSDKYRERFSGTKIREMLRRGEKPPEYFLRPEVYQVVKNFRDPFV
ncbi:sulfate adenylyltransferase [Archaeoglobales archaeon]|nr:MAG: sulfate adenylyltransferase [Archaeoglobales archaeon]HDN74111.1 sulfate adenylyltransferase [Archaeoglobus sp.]